MEARQPCKLLEWDTAFFGVRIATMTAGDLRPERVKAAVDWCRANRVDCLYALSDAGDTEGARALEQAGARNVDVRTTLALEMAQRKRHEHAAGAPGHEAVTLRVASATDIPVLRALAARSHTNSRFWADQRFSRERCGELYATWIEKSVRGWADHVFVPEIGGKPVGYLSCHSRAAQRGEIGLVAIDAAAQGRGLGGEMLDAGLDWFAAHGLTRAVVVTQGANAGALQLYQSRGFRTESSQLWHHLWFSGQMAVR